MPTAVKAGRQRYIVLALITLALALSTGDRATLSVAGPHMSKELGLGPVEMGWLFSAFAWAYVLGQVPAGWLVDKIGAKRAMLMGILLWSVATVLMGVVGIFPSVFVALLILRFLLGAFETPIGPGSGRIIAAWFPSSERGMSGSIFNAAQYLSLVLFTPLMGWLDYTYGWHHIYFVMGAIGLVMAAFWAFNYYQPAQHPRVTQAELDYIRAGGALVDGDKVSAKSETAAATLKHIGSLFRSRMLCGIFLAQYCITAISWFFLSWFPTYLVKARGFTILDAGMIAALPAICGCIGGVSAGFFSDWLLRRTGSLTFARKIPITIGLLGSASIVLCNYTQSDAVVISLMCAAFFGKGFGNLGWTVIADTAPKEIVGITGGVFNGLGQCSGIITPLVIGYILANTGSFEGALLFTGLHGVVAVLCYWIIVGRIERLDLNIQQKSPEPAYAK